MADRIAVREFLAEHGSERVARLGELAGVLTYIAAGDSWEILTLHAAEPGIGAGTALVDQVERVAAAGGCRRLWVLTTNDNVDALKPEIPRVGNHGIPLCDELVLEKEVG
jgi:GNAT superfamily N-acetyltransferase